MAFAQSLLYKSVAVGARPAITVYFYTSFDLFNDILATGYFRRNPRFEFRYKDLVICQCPDGLHFAEVTQDITTVQPTYQPVVGSLLVNSESTLLVQEPTGLDTPMVVDFGGPVGTSEDKLQILPNQCLQANVALNNLHARMKLQIGRVDEPMQAHLYMRVVLNGTTQLGTTLYARIDDSTTAFPFYFNAPLTMEPGDTICFELIRDSAGANAGGLYVENPTLAGWNNASTASLLVYENIVR